MGHEFIALLRGGIQTYRVVHVVFLCKRDFRVSAVHRTGGSKDKVRSFSFVRALQEIDESHNVALHIEMRILQGVAYPGLRRQVDDRTELLPREQILHPRKIGDFALNKLESCGLLQHLQAGVLEPFVVKRIEVINPKHLVSRCQESPTHVKTDKACTPCNQYSGHSPNLPFLTRSLDASHLLAEHDRLTSFLSHIISTLEGVSRLEWRDE